MNNIKVLIVEDEAITAIFLKAELSRHKLNVLPPTGMAEKAIQVSLAEKPDLILMDINLASKKNGIEAAREILLAYSPLIIFITGYDDEKYREEIASLKSLIVHKPFEPQFILKLIKQKLPDKF